MPNVDGRVTGLNADVFSTLQNIKSKNRGQLTESDANLIKTAVNRDGKIDTAENDLLTELTQDNLRSINISSSSAPTQSVVFATTSGRTKSQLVEAQTPTSYLNQLSEKGADGFKELAAIYQRSPADANRVVNFLANKANEAWDKSSIGNGYGPLRSMITGAYSGINQLQGKDNEAGRWMLHRAIEKADRTVTGGNGPIPDIMYNWIRPGGAL